MIGSSVYVLFKDEMRLCTGEVTFVGNPKQVFNGNNFFAPKYSVDLKVNVGGQNYEFSQLPGDADAFWYSNTLVCENKDAAIREVDAICLASQRHIENTPYHEKILEAGMKIKADLNPQLKKEAEQAEKIESLQKQIESMQAMLSEVLGHSKKEK